MTDEKRPYRKKRRAELEELTRLRITESAVALHGTVGPALTSMSAVADHAGVPRSTLYRHFPDELALFQACSAHWRAANPPPDIGAWAQVDDPDERLARALGELYAFYRRTEAMLANLYRDEATVPSVGRMFGRFREYLAAARDVLLRGRSLRGGARRRTAAALGHALAFATWRSLAREEGLRDDEAAALMCSFVALSSVHKA